jgi:polysaccharide export outer membrane protein
MPRDCTIAIRSTSCRVLEHTAARGSFVRLIVAALLLVTGVGCNIYGRPQRTAAHQATLEANCDGDPAKMPAKELAKVSLPPYVIEPPDILLIDALRIVPKPPFRIQSFDSLQVIVEGTLLEQPINGIYVVEPGGLLDLGPSYGKVAVGGKSLDEAQDAVFRHLKRVLREPQVSLTINLGTYGNVYVTGMTLAEAKEAIESQLDKFLDAPLVSVDVFSYNSKVYYVITEGAGQGDNVARFPVTGNETVLDAIAQINGLSKLSSKEIWIARPAPSGIGCDQVLPVDIDAIMRGGATATNYQLLPGDRVFIAQDPWIAFNGVIEKVTAPFEQILGTTLLGAQTVYTFQRGANFGIGGICWVAREVYGEENPKWLLFRAWLLTEAPDWLRDAYHTHGEAFAAWIHDKPLVKLAVRAVMDSILAFRGADLAETWGIDTTVAGPQASENE